MTIYCGVDFHACQQAVCYCDSAGGEISLQEEDHERDDVRGFYSAFTGEMGNPNCFVNAVPGSAGIARNYVNNHDGFHARRPGDVVVLPALDGALCRLCCKTRAASELLFSSGSSTNPPGKILAKQNKSPFKWRHFEPTIIFLCGRWYCRYQLSYRDLEEMIKERGLSVDHTTVWR